MADVWCVGDVHGQLERLRDILTGAGLTRPDLSWSGGTARLWFAGDFTDRGPQGVAVIDAVMRLQREAAEAGGFVGALLGNHDVLIVAARLLGERPTSGLEGTFRAEWLANGGELADLSALLPAHVDWLTRLPAMAREGDLLLVHADATFYLRYGQTVEEVNAAICRVLAERDDRAWDRLLGQFSSRNAFMPRGVGVEQARTLLATFGGRRIVHGHTPIPLAAGQDPTSVRGPLIYADGLCVNIDGGLYLGGPGFAWKASVD